MKKILTLLLLIALLTTACSLDFSTDPDIKNWNLIVKSAKETTVNITIQHSNPLTITWFKEVFVPYVLENHQIKVNIVEQKFAKTMEELSSDKLNEIEIGTHDIIIFERSGFKEAYDKGVLYGPFSDKMVDLKQYLDMESLEFMTHEGIDAKHFMVPYGRKQLSFIYNQDIFYDKPENLDMFMETLQTYKGQFTYPDPRQSYEGMAFILTVVGQNFDFEPFSSGKLDRAKVVAAIQPGMNQLIAMKPYLKDGGSKYPASTQELDDLFINGALMMSLSMDYNYATSKLKEYEYPEGASTFVLPTGMATFTEAASIAFNAPNKSGAMVVINALLEPQMQASKYDPKQWGSLPIYSEKTLTEPFMEPFKAVKLKSTTENYKAFIEAAMPEFGPELRKIILEEWVKQVLN